MSYTRRAEYDNTSLYTHLIQLRLINRRTNMNGSPFHYFTRLPPEIRHLIWQHCLPCRVAQEDEAYFLLDGNESRQACLANRIRVRNSQPPAIAFVSKESRQVALEHGVELELQDTLSMDLIWVQPRRDMLHLNWVRRRYNVWGNADDPTSPICMFLWRAEDHRMEPSVVAEIIHPFDLEALLNGGEGAIVSRDPWLFYHNGQNQELSDIAACVDWQRSIGIAMAAVSLHITEEAALQSGLFGLLGDAPVQMVDFKDDARLREFQALFEQHALDKEPVVQTFFKLFASPEFKTAVESWRQQAEWLILAYMWQRARDENIDKLGAKPGLAWVPELVEQKYIHMSQYVPNGEHPWVKEARQSMPELRPRIMVQYCINECYKQGRLPKWFGSC